MNGQKLSSGFRQPAIHVPSSGFIKPTVPIPVSEESTSATASSQDHSEAENAGNSPPQTSYEQDNTSPENLPARYVKSCFSTNIHVFPPKHFSTLYMYRLSARQRRYVGKNTTAG